MCTDGRRCDNCPARRLGAGARTVAEALPALGTVVSVTANDAALLSHTGEYLPPAFPGEALRCDDTNISLRVNPALVEDTFLGARALTLANTTGTHRAYLTPMSDRMVVEALALAPDACVETVDEPDWSTLDWAGSDQITHLDALTPERYRVLPFTGARRVEPRVMPFLLAHLAEMGLAYTVGVPGGGCLQLHRGPAALVEPGDGHVSVVFGAARFALDPTYVAECWVTRVHGVTGPTSTIELYDHGNRCVTILTQTGPICPHLGEAWEAITASLPEV